MCSRPLTRQRSRRQSLWRPCSFFVKHVPPDLGEEQCRAPRGFRSSLVSRRGGKRDAPTVSEDPVWSREAGGAGRARGAEARRSRVAVGAVGPARATGGGRPGTTLAGRTRAGRKARCWGAKGPLTRIPWAVSVPPCSQSSSSAKLRHAGAERP